MRGDKGKPSKDIRVITRIPGAHPELLQDLLALPARDRPERLRTLATIALAILAARGAAVVTDSAPVSEVVKDRKTVERRAAFSLLKASVRPD